MQLVFAANPWMLEGTIADLHHVRHCQAEDPFQCPLCAPGIQMLKAASEHRESCTIRATQGRAGCGACEAWFTTLGLFRAFERMLGFPQNNVEQRVGDEYMDALFEVLH